jgi:hypothetical protein
MCPQSGSLTQECLPCSINIQFVCFMAAMHDLALVPNERAQNKRLTIRIPRWAWNSYEPQALAHSNKVTRSTTNTKAMHKLDVNTADGEGGRNKKHTLGGSVVEDGVAAPPVYTRHCKAKLWTFHYGGPKRVLKGIQQNCVTFETPCLQSTCANCWKWHAHLMHNQNRAKESIKRNTYMETDLVLPEIDHES